MQGDEPGGREERKQEEGKGDREFGTNSLSGSGDTQGPGRVQAGFRVQVWGLGFGVQSFGLRVRVSG